MQTVLLDWIEQEGGGGGTTEGLRRGRGEGRGGDTLKKMVAVLGNTVEHICCATKALNAAAPL